MTENGAPFTWLCSFLANFAWAPWTCIFQVKLGLYAISGVALLIEAVLAFIAWREWQGAGKEWAGDGGTSLARVRLMAIGGFFASLGFFFVVVAQSVPELMLAACE